jgi:hypothetical protein
MIAGGKGCYQQLIGRPRRIIVSDAKTKRRTSECIGTRQEFSLDRDLAKNLRGQGALGERRGYYGPPPNASWH